jgi:hypothetical protein
VASLTDLRPLLVVRERRVRELQELARAEAEARGHRLYGEWFYPRAVWLPLSITFCTVCGMCVVADAGVEDGLRLRGGAVKMGCLETKGD